MTISPFWLCVILQLDSFCSGAHFLAGIAVIAAGISVMAYVWMCANEDPECKTEKDKTEWRSIKHRFRNVFIFGVLFAFICGAVPTTKQAAAIVMVPRIANSGFLQDELPDDARMLYDMAKQYLAEQLKTESKK